MTVSVVRPLSYHLQLGKHSAKYDLMKTEAIAVIGLGYVGLPLALALARKFPNTIGFDINSHKVTALRAFSDPSGEVEYEELKTCSLKITSDVKDLKGRSFVIVAVPTPVDKQKRPDLSPLLGASKIIGSVLEPGAIVVFESTVYPGVTEEICGPAIEQASGLKVGRDFKLGYSPERINPGDKEHTIDRIVKIVSAQDPESLDRVANVYGSIVHPGVYRAASIKVAEAAKVIENTQRDLNIALMNELAIIFDRLGICTTEVLNAAGTKWNFLPFKPGLVGGHCIGVDPYYLTSKAEEVGYHPEVILAGRRINDRMGAFVAQKTIKLIANRISSLKHARVGLLGLTFKENVSDIRNSRVPDIVSELREFGIQAIVHDPCVSHSEAKHEYGIELAEWDSFHGLDALIVAVPHRVFLDLPIKELTGCLKPDGVFVDVKAAFPSVGVIDNLKYWSL